MNRRLLHTPAKPNHLPSAYLNFFEPPQLLHNLRPPLLVFTPPLRPPNHRRRLLTTHHPRRRPEEGYRVLGMRRHDSTLNGTRAPAEKHPPVLMPPRHRVLGRRTR